MTRHSAEQLLRRGRTRTVCALLMAMAALLASGCAALGRSKTVVTVHGTGSAVMEEAGSEGLGVSPGALTAVGVGFPAAESGNRSQMMLTAMEAAKYRALASLAAQVEGLQISRESRVLNMQFAGEAIEARVEGLLSGARVVKSEWDPNEGVAKVTVALPGAGGALATAPAPDSRTARRERAVAAARLEALADLRRQLGRVRVGEQVIVQNLVLRHQEAWKAVEGMLQGAELSEPRWPERGRCEVRATLRVTEADLARLRAAGE